MSSAELNIDDLKVVQLREELKKRGLDTKGMKFKDIISVESDKPKGCVLFITLHSVYFRA